ncbi:MAG: ArsC/Spx/MgsR family protein [Caldimonas sp.]
MPRLDRRAIRSARCHVVRGDAASREPGPVRTLVRVHSPHGDDLGLYDPRWSDDALLQLVLERPVFLDRPIVVTALGTKLCRPSETLLELLPVPRPPFTKEDAASWWIAVNAGGQGQSPTPASK